jgi:hypothetical protein
MPQTPFQFSFEGDPYVAMIKVESIPGILPKEVTALQELIFHACECCPMPTWVGVEASLVVEPSELWQGNQCSIRQQVTFNAVAKDGNFSFTPSPTDPGAMEKLIDNQKIAQYVRWSWHNACDQPALSGASVMSGSVTQEIQGNRTLTKMDYSFPYNL